MNNGVSMLSTFRRVVRLDGFGDDGAGRVTFLVVLALRCNRPRHVTTRHRYHACQNDGHN